MKNYNVKIESLGCEASDPVEAAMSFLHDIQVEDFTWLIEVEDANTGEKFIVNSFSEKVEENAK